MKSVKNSGAAILGLLKYRPRSGGARRDRNLECQLEPLEGRMVLSGVSNTLIVLTGGQNFGLDSSLKDVFNPFSKGKGYGVQPWVRDVAAHTERVLANEDTGLKQSDATVRIIEVDWATYGRQNKPTDFVAGRIREIVSQPGAGSWDILLVGNSRGAIFNDQVALKLHNSANVDYAESILIDPTAAHFFGDKYPRVVPAGIDREIVLDDGYPFPTDYFVSGIVSDGQPVPGAEYENVNAELNDDIHADGIHGERDRAIKSHTDVPYWYDRQQFARDLREFVRRKDSQADRAASASGPHDGPRVTTEVLHAPADLIGIDLVKLGRKLAGAAARAADNVGREAGRIGKDITRGVTSIGNRASKVAGHVTDGIQKGLGHAAHDAGHAAQDVEHAAEDAVSGAKKAIKKIGKKLGF
jgi:hypothetical protein